MTTFCEREEDHECGADYHVSPDNSPRTPYALRLEELKEASHSLQMSISIAKAELKRNGPELDPYMLQYRDGSLVLIPMLADQVVIQNQIEKLEKEEHVRAENLKAFEHQMARPFEGVVCLTEIKVYSNTVGIEGSKPASTYLCTNARPCPDHPEEKSL